MSTQMVLDRKLLKEDINKVPHPISEVMSSNYISIEQHESVDSALATIRLSPLENKHVSLILVIDNYGRYQGLVRLSRLLRSEATVKVSQLMTGEEDFARYDASSLEGAKLLQRKDLPLLPIIDEQKKLLGVLTFDDAMDVLEQASSDDMYWKAGVGDVTHHNDAVRSEKLTQGAIGYTLKVRLAFLTVTLIGGLLVGGLIDHFEEVLGAILALAIFIPLVMDMGGNVGTQSSTIFARGLALGHIKMDQFFKNHMLRELKVGLAMGLLLSTMAGLIAYYWQGVPNDIPMLGVVVGVALMFSVTTGSLLGFLLPWLMLKIGVDHAPGADPFITTIKDFSGLAVYFLMAAWLLGLAI